jgi:hypothetical protein
MSQHHQLKLSRRCSPALAHVRFSILDHFENLEMLRVLDSSKRSSSFHGVLVSLEVSMHYTAMYHLDPKDNASRDMMYCLFSMDSLLCLQTGVQRNLRDAIVRLRP